jgi:S-DNA-T family DNA segregation ATPase FtsK/SpoIIIE
LKATAMPTDSSLFDRQRAAFARLLQLVRDRAAGERAIADAFAAATTEAEREIQKARRTIAAARKKTLDDLDSNYRAALADLTGRLDAAQADADRKRHEVRKRAVNEYSAALEKTRGEYRDKLWTVDSLHEAGEKEARDRYEELKRKAAASAKRIDAIWAAARPRLARVGLTPEKVAFDPARLPSPTQTDPVGKVQKCLEDVDAAADRLAHAPLPKLLGIGPTIVLILLAGGLGAALAFPQIDWPTNLYVTLAWAVVGGLFFRVLLGVFARRQVKDRGCALGVYLAEAGRAVRTLDEHAEATHAARRKELADQHADARRKADEKYQPRIASLEQQLDAALAGIEADHARFTAELRTRRETETKAEEDRHAAAVAEATARFDAELADAENRFSTKTADATATRDRDWDKLANDWQTGLAEVAAVCRHLADFGARRFPPWPQVSAPDYPLPTEVPPGVRFGEYDVELYALPDGMPFDPRLNPADPLNTTVPAYLPFPDRCSVLLKASDEGRPAAVAALQAMMLRFLTGLPPGKVRFTIIDPVGLGENFAAFMHLADHDEKLVTSRIWTEPPHIEQRLADLTEHMENVIQKYLRNQYSSIEEYNRAAGEVAEPYRVLVVANFPTNFTPDAARRLISIMSSGPACGVCTLVSVDTAAAMPRDFRLADLEQVAFNLTWAGRDFRPKDPDLAAFPLRTDVPPPPETIADVVRRVGLASIEAARVEVPFEFIMPPPDRVWAADASRGLDVPIGRAGATRRQVFSLGKGTAQHALVAGKTGSGKSTLLHALITNLALTYGPDEVELYLIDFKKGVEFKAYAQHQLPHARVVAIESEREFGLSVLQRLDGILRERGDAFRAAGVNDLASYREARPDEKAPRILLIVDEFQEFFTEDDKLAQEAALLLDRLVRQGRAFGIHVLLGSQTLGGAYSLARSTIDQMAVRIALQCSEADAQLILSKDNTAARLLNRPGEAIYNDANGRVEGNDPFQVVWLDEDRREELLSQLHGRGNGKQYPPPLVFEGNATADITRNDYLARLLAAPADRLPQTPPTAWLGEAIAIKDPTAAVFRPQSAANLLLLGQHEEAALGLISASLVALSARLRPNGANGRTFTVIDGTPDDSEYANFLRNAATAVGLADAVVERPNLPAAVGELAAELARRQNGETPDRSPRFLVVHGLQRLRELRKPEDDFGFGRKGEREPTPGEQFVAIIRDGPPLGVHVICWCDTLTNLQRALDRQALRDFALRVLFQMSPADSSNLIDSPAASRLGRNRALYVEEGTERPEKFRPYGLPAMSWLRKVGEQLRVVPAGGHA